jgi:hypothetical protein
MPVNWLQVASGQNEQQPTSSFAPLEQQKKEISAVIDVLFMALC